MFKHIRYLTLISVLFFTYGMCVLSNNVYADELYLKNKDKISGEMIEENEDSISVKTEAMGTISLKREFIERVVSAKAEEAPPEKVAAEGKVAWDGSASAGYNAARGNTETDQLSVSLFLNRNRHHVDEITLKGDVYYSAANKDTDAQKLYGAGRYAFSFGETKKWYNFYMLEAGHDRFANIDYRLIPSTGLGYWFFDLPDTKLMAEGAIGLEHTNFSDDTEKRNELALMPRAFFEQKIFVNSRLIEDIKAYPSLTDFGEYRLRSETTLINPITDKLSVNFSLIDEYNSYPPEDTKKNDLRFISSLAYSF